ncbi:stomatin [Lampris incognitus]|uniref:stomatin n=1 Tax=Lampris incognitus TaxID=2546036 RepID=UPI0024B61834|nr:stomatin [Lampris incognitus]
MFGISSSINKFCFSVDEGKVSGVSEVLVGVPTVLSPAFIVSTLRVTVRVCVKVVREYERAVIFRLGRLIRGKAKGPGMIWVIPWLDVIQKVDLRTVYFDLPPQEVVTADWVPLKVDAVVFYRVVDPSLWVTRVADGPLATHTLAATTLRATLGAHTLVDILAQRKDVAQKIEEVVYAASRQWGAQVERVELKHLALPPGLQRCMASEAEAVREARAKLIVAEGEGRVSNVYKEVPGGLSPVALQLRLLQSLSSVVSDTTTTVILPWPQNLLQTFIAKHSHVSHSA